VPGDLVQAPAAGKVVRNVGAHRVDHLDRIRGEAVAPKPVGSDQDRGRVVIGRAAQHHPVKALVQECLRLREAGDPAVDADYKVGEPLLHLQHEVVVQGRDLAVLLRRKALEPGLARMDDDVADPCPGQRLDEMGQDSFRILLIDADAALHRHRGVGFRLHRADTVGDKLWPLHQHCAEAAGLHAVRGTTAVQVDLVIGPGRCDPHGLGQLARVRTAQLKGNRVFDRRVVQEPWLGAVDDGGCSDHFRIEHRPPGHLAVEDAAMPVRPVHHGRDGQAMGVRGGGIGRHAPLLPRIADRGNRIGLALTRTRRHPGPCQRRRRNCISRSLARVGLSSPGCRS
jgi:hypothetical protein